MSNALELPDDVVIAEARRRQRARAAGLPLSATLAEIERAERGYPAPDGCRIGASIEAPKPRAEYSEIIPDEAVPDCVCQHTGALHDGKGHCTVCRCRRYRSREEQVEQKGDEFMRRYGFTVIRLSQRRRSKVHNGLPDRLYVNRARRLGVWWEAKAEDGRRSDAQRQFEQDVEGCGYGYVTGGVGELRAWLARNLDSAHRSVSSLRGCEQDGVRDAYANHPSHRPMPHPGAP